jgi:hypothetical protein
MNYLTEIDEKLHPDQVLKNIGHDNYEKFPVKFIKWSLSVHSKASNVGCWGEIGHHPLSLKPPNFPNCFRLLSLNKSHLSSCSTQICASYSQNIISRKHRPPFEKVDSKPKSPTPCAKNLLKSGWIARPNPLSRNSITRLNMTLNLNRTYLNVIKFLEARINLTRLLISSHNLNIQRDR